MNVDDANKIFRRAIIKSFFEPYLLERGFKRSDVRHPQLVDCHGMMRSKILYIFFDVETGADYPDGDEWFIVDMLAPGKLDLPDELHCIDYFTNVFGDENADKPDYWHHRELVRYKCGKSKKLDDALEFIDSKYGELTNLLEELDKVIS